MELDGPAQALRRYSERLHARAGDGHHVVSPLGAWMVVALCAPLATERGDREVLAGALGTDPDDAFDLAVDLLDHPHPLVPAAAALWLRAGTETRRLTSWRAALPAAVDTGDLPTQVQADAWAAERTLGLVERFPIEITPALVCVLASALATKVSWEVPFDVVDATALGLSPWSAEVRTVLRAPTGDPRHRQFLTGSGRIGTACVHLAAARGGLLVGSVIAGDERASAGEVLGAAEEIVTAEARTRGSVPRLSLFDLPLGEGPVWSVAEEAVETTARDGREEHVVSCLPAWRAETAVTLSGDEHLGFDDAARIIASALELRRWDHEARQACVARYDARGFEAAAVTGLAVRVAMQIPRPGVRRVATVRFARPYAVVAAAFDDRRDEDAGGAPPSCWSGLPVFSAWITEPAEAG